MSSSEVSAVCMTATFPRSWAQQLGFLCDHARIHADFSALLGYLSWHHWSPPFWKPESVFSEARGHAEVLEICFPKVEKAWGLMLDEAGNLNLALLQHGSLLLPKLNVSGASPSMIQYHSALRTVPRSNASCGSSVLNTKWSSKRMCGWSSLHPRSFWGICYGSSLNQCWVPY